MNMRIILYTGKGGVGKTSIAAATAVASAEKRVKNARYQYLTPLIVSGIPLICSSPTNPFRIRENLWAQEIDSTHEIEKDWGQVQAYLLRLFTSQNINSITAEELIHLSGTGRPAQSAENHRVL